MKNGAVQHTIWFGTHHRVPSELMVEERDGTLFCQLTPITEGVIADLAKGVVSFAKSHPFLTGWAAIAAAGSLYKYNEAKKQAISLFAKDMPEKITYAKLVRDLEKYGYRVVKSGYKGGAGYFWELRKK